MPAAHCVNTGLLVNPQILLYNTYTFNIASLILVSQDLKTEESGQKGYFAPKNVFRKTADMLPLIAS